MATGLHGNLNVWSLRKILSQQGDNHPGIHIYQDKNTAEELYAECKKEWIERRGMIWTLTNRRPEKLRDNLHELEELMDTFPVAAVKWRSSRHLQILLSNGTFVSVAIGLNFGDVERILIDKSLNGKLMDQIHNAVIDELYMVFTFAEKSKVAFVYFGRRVLEKKEGEKLNSLEPKISLIDIPGPTGRIVDRRLSVNCRGDLVCVWWPSSSEAAWPWSPLAADIGRINFVILAVSSTQLDVLCHMHTDADPLSISFSYTQPNHLHSIESSQTSNGKCNLKSCIYECNQNKVQKVACITVPIKGAVVTGGRNHREDKLLLACDDGTLVLYDEHRQLTQTSKATLPSPSFVAWHPTDAAVLIANSRGDFQIFDMALACISLNLSSESTDPSFCCSIGQFFINPCKFDKVTWACDFGLGPPPDVIGCYDDLLFILDRGPICVIRINLGIISNGRLGPVELVSEYINNRQELQAVSLLNSMNWNTNGNLCFTCLTIIIDYLFRCPFNLEREACIEDALGSFYAPSRTISDMVMVQFCHPISRLARRFFHHLLRHKRFEKAFLLAVDIGAKDLFMDIHYLANDMGNLPLAEAAKQRAMQIDIEDANPNAILEGSDYSTDENPGTPYAFYDQHGYGNANHSVPNYELKAENEKFAHSIDSGYHPVKSEDKQNSRNGRKLGMTKYNLPSNVTGAVVYDNIKWNQESNHIIKYNNESGQENVKSGKKKLQDHGSESKNSNKNSKLEVIHFGLV